MFWQVVGMCDIMETGEKRNTLPMGGDFQFFVVWFFSSELDGDVASVKAVYEKTKAKNIQLHELSLKSLAAFLKKVGEPVPFTEPPVSIS